MGLCSANRRQDDSYVSLLAAAQLTIKEPCRATEVDQTGCSIEDHRGYTLRKMKLNATSPTWDDGLWAALICKARNPRKFKMDVSDVEVVDRLGYLARSMIINSIGQCIEEHIYASDRKDEIASLMCSSMH